jgi:hypothetical protein
MKPDSYPPHFSVTLLASEPVIRLDILRRALNEYPLFEFEDARTETTAGRIIGLLGLRLLRQHSGIPLDVEEDFRYRTKTHRPATVFVPQMPSGWRSAAGSFERAGILLTFIQCERHPSGASMPLDFVFGPYFDAELRKARAGLTVTGHDVRDRLIELEKTAKAFEPFGYRLIAKQREELDTVMRMADLVFDPQ